MKYIIIEICQSSIRKTKFKISKDTFFKKLLFIVKINFYGVDLYNWLDPLIPPTQNSKQSVTIEDIRHRLYLDKKKTAQILV